MSRQLAIQKLKIFFTTVIIIVLTIMSQGTLAFYSTVGTATNVVTSGSIRFLILEKTDDGSDFPKEGVTIVPGDTVSKKVSIKSECDHPFYLRVKLIYGVSGNDELMSDDLFELDIDTANWIEKDGWLYYKEIVQPEATTTEAFTKVHIVGAKVDNGYIGKALTLKVSAQAVQSENNPATEPWEALGWPEE